MHAGRILAALKSALGRKAAVTLQEELFAFPPTEFALGTDIPRH
jgi:hypothetical protein